MKFISVEKELPPEKKQHRSDIVVVWLSSGRWLPAKYSYFTKKWQFDGFTSADEKATHWMEVKAPLNY